jgi:uncharacterized protein YceK
VAEISRACLRWLVPARAETCHGLPVAPPVSPGSGRVRDAGSQSSRLINMRKFAIASLLVAGVALCGSVMAQDAASQAAPATKTASSAQPAHSSSHHHKKKSDQSGGSTHKGKSAKKSAKSTLPATTTSH